MTGFSHVNGASRRIANVPAFGDPFGVFSRDIDRVLGSFLGRGALRPTQAQGDAEATDTTKTLNPRIDVHESDDAIELSAELPGVEQDDVDVSVLEGVLTVKGEKKSTRESNEGARVVERSYGSFTRSFRLPENVDADNISATFKNGVLTLSLPKVVEQKPEPRKISVAGAQ
ncbi:Hsp20/alpha crystallin family protein [Thalassospira sp. MCCC 1A01428]|uniref:Hsp20/alpha crystallin family protein n=2 Tax=unclassified Thalassospira TaxID=2648997 RepID=UPI000A1EC853|nr:Hsp20/alpha crystallin family protein [Thalassospira sp. MCCC 1A01428]OSQ44754.1 heat-shock protein Hsp20 [Thalassospira sp. MCCC 1A01428]